jgi:hypothetical protein
VDWATTAVVFISRLEVQYLPLCNAIDDIEHIRENPG